MAFTHKFKGSPHIDKQNTGPFYGLSLGNFPAGQGGVRVECSARVGKYLKHEYCIKNDDFCI